MKVLILISFVTLFSLNCFASSITEENCLDKVGFSLPFLYPGALDAKLIKEANKLQILIFKGVGEKYELDLSQGDISILVYPSIESSKAEKLRAGSANCSKPLFGADFSLKDGEADRFHENREKMFSYINVVQKNYAKDTSIKSKLDCTIELVHEYLSDCQSIAPAKAN